MPSSGIPNDADESSGDTYSRGYEEGISFHCIFIFPLSDIY